MTEETITASNMAGLEVAQVQRVGSVGGGAMGGVLMGTDVAFYNVLQQAHLQLRNTSYTSIHTYIHLHT